MVSRKQLLVVLLTLLVVVTGAWAAPEVRPPLPGQPLGSFQADHGRVYRLGGLPTPKSIIARSPQIKPLLRPQAALPPMVDLSAQMPPVGDQGQQGSCTAWACGYYYKSFQEARERGWSMASPEHRYSAAWTYNQTNFGEDNGSWPQAALELFATKGAASEADWPYNDRDYTTWPTLSQYLAAMPARSQEYAYFFDSMGDGRLAMDALKQHLANGDCFVIIIPIFSDFSPHAPFYLYDGPSEGAEFEGTHSVCVVGYDDTIGGVGGFKFRNSWSEDWGDNGSAYLSYDFFRTYAMEAWAMVDRTGYVPQAWARVGIQHANRSDLVVSLGVGAPQAPAWSVRVYENQGGTGNNINCYVDVSDFGTVLGDWWVKVRDTSTGTTGTITDFALLFNGAETASNDIPVAVPDNLDTLARLRWALDDLTLRVSTANGTPLSAQNFVTVTYRRLGLTQTVQLWDGQVAQIQADASVSPMFSPASSASTAAERWQLEPSVIAPAAAGTLEKRYFHQLRKLFRADSVGTPALSQDNYAPVSFTSFGAASVARAWEAPDPGDAVWADMGTAYGYGRTSLRSGERERWFCPEPPTGHVTDNQPVTTSYWRQCQVNLTLPGTDSTHRASLLERTLLGVPKPITANPAAGKGLFDTWQGWADADTLVRVGERIVGNPDLLTSDSTRWTITQPLSATCTFAPAFRLAGRVRDASGVGLAGVRLTVGNASTHSDARGRYVFPDLPAGSYTILASLPEWSFTPASITVDLAVTTGNPAEGTLTFTGTQAPGLVAWAPTGTVATLAPAVQITFDRAMNKAQTQAAFSLQLLDTASGAPVSPISGDFQWNSSGGQQIMTFTPKWRLEPYRLYRATLGIGAGSLQGSPLPQELTWTFQTGDSLGVLTYAPRSQRSSLTAPIFIEFDRDVHRASLENNFQMVPSTPGSFVYDGLRRVRYVPAAPLTPGALYTVVLGRNTRGADGVLLGQDFRWTFNAEGAVQVTAVTPADAAVGVAQTVPVEVTFDRAMDRVLTQAAFSLTDTASGQAVSGVFSWNAESSRLTFRPREWLKRLTTYRARLAGGAQSASGAPLAAERVWTFQVADVLQVTDFGPRTRTAPVNATVDLLFDRDVNPATFQLTLTPALAGNLTWLSNRAVRFTPAQPLALDTTYRVAVAGATAGADGVALGSDFSWSFRTAGATQVLAYGPRGVGVLPAATVVLVFDRAMNRPSVESLLQVWQQGAAPQQVGGTFRWENGDTRLVFTPLAWYSNLTDYRVLLPRTARSSDGVELAAPLDWVFQCGEFLRVASVTPTGNNVPRGTVVDLTFDREVNRASVERGFRLTPAVAGQFQWVSATEVRFVPHSPLAAGTVYEVLLSANTLSRSGLSLGSRYAWSFTTGASLTAAQGGGAVLSGVAAAQAGSGVAQIGLTLSAAAMVEARVLNLAGRTVAVVDGGLQSAGTHTLLWNGRGLAGTQVPAGAYLVQVVARDSQGGRSSALTPLQVR